MKLSVSIRSMGFEKDHEWNVRWMREARRILKPNATLWVSGTHHIIFSLGFALQSLDFRIINQIVWHKPDPVPNALHTAFTHAHETLLWASKGRGARHTFNYDLINSPNPTTQVSSVWRIPTVPKSEKRIGYHPGVIPPPQRRRCGPTALPAAARGMSRSCLESGHDPGGRERGTTRGAAADVHRTN